MVNYMTWQRRSVTRTSTGEKEEVWTDNGYLWATINELTGITRENTIGGPRSGSQANLLIRNRPTLRARDKLVFNNRTWLVEYLHRVDPDETQAYCVSFDEGDIWT